jgi:glycosyltransferase involved in cell wall biosynthesis
MINPRIYIVISDFLPGVGGAEKQALAQGRSLRERGYQATIITFRRARSWPKREVMGGVPVIRVAGLLMADRERLPRLLQKLAYLMALAVMGWALWRHRQCFDILHVYKLNLLALPTALVCRLTSKPMIIAVRAADSGKAAKSQNTVSLIAEPAGATVRWQQVDGRTRVEGDLDDLARLGKPVVRFARSLLYSIHAVVVVLSSRTRDYLATHDFHLPDVQLIPNGVDITRFTPPRVDASINERAQVVVCVSKLRYQKGIDVLLQAWHLVHQHAPQARLIIVGNGPLQAQLERLAQTLDIADSVQFTGLQSDVTAQLHRGSLAVLSSRWEGMPNAVLEAMACGLPCVATRVSGSEDIIQHGVNGLLVEPEDFQGIAQALLTLLRDPVLAQKYGQAALETIERHYSLEQMMDKYIALYQKMADHHWRIAEDTSRSKICRLSS